MRPEILERRVEYSGKRVTVLRDVIRLMGAVVEREIVDIGVPVAILPFLDDDTIVLERQYRHPVGEWIVEIPAGLVKKGETLEEAARRELLEETGYLAERLWTLARIYPSPGYCKEVLTIFVAQGLKKASPRPDADEFIETFEVKFDRALEMVMNGEISDGKTAIAILLYHLRHRMRGK